MMDENFNGAIYETRSVFITALFISAIGSFIISILAICE